MVNRFHAGRGTGAIGGSVDMTETYRVVQWATGSIGQIAIRHVVDNPIFELLGVDVTNEAKVGKDAGELAGAPTTGVLATDDLGGSSTCGLTQLDIGVVQPRGLVRPPIGRLR
jgi:hypothetical protein